jgi:plasmid replication initiation protein
MIRRSWVIYRRKSRRIISIVYHFRKDALRDLNRLNSYYGKRHYAMRLMKTDSETGKIVSRYPDIELKALPKPEEGYG